ncbi:hypothetical protein IC757_02945 [Wenzhouxiangella sp. AB-CW3]|uniref:hypothetical protein n=1 Tax=Wenzhouxiangella sp. AB-CW3 TaxID=2771012 RepID=UPI00168A7779|nr:hypothetical protein [Wenzhouxiangella sp. AB-CW3]QOC23133.1 hypothetical protein IC757_02945 [Wenzhouxiangella sp. AB-CW3]
MNYARRRRLARARQWLVDHDNRATFTILYITLALVLSMAISMFWLAAVVAAHGIIEYWALGRNGVDDRRLGRTLWHIKLDIALVLAALWLGLYIDLLFGIAGLSAAARTGAQATARFVAWQRTIRGVLLATDEAALAAKAALGNNGKDSVQTPQKRDIPPRPWRQRWSIGDWLTMGSIAILLVMILAAPLMTDHSVAEAIAILAEDLHPWPY